MTLTKQPAKTDRELQLDVLAELNRDWRFAPAEIGVEVDEGVVTLVGTVSSYVKIGQAADVAARVAGVKDVANKLAVELRDAWKRDDTKIAAAVRDALIWDADIPEERIDAIVRSGVVTLKGSVDSWYQRRRASETVGCLTGVRGVDNLLTVAIPSRGDLEIRREIEAALRRRLPASEIDVAVDRGFVTLTGRIGSYGMRREAEEAAFSARGVTGVLNKITVVFF